MEFFRNTQEVLISLRMRLIRLFPVIWKPAFQAPYIISKIYDFNKQTYERAPTTLLFSPICMHLQFMCAEFDSVALYTGCF